MKITSAAKQLRGSFRAIVVAGLVTAAVQAAFLAGTSPVLPGGPSVTVTLTSAAQGTLLASLISPYSFSTTSGVTSGTVTSAVYKNSSGTLDFYYQVANSAASATALAREINTNFTGSATQVAFRTDGGALGGSFVNGSGGIIPVSADRDASASTVGFNFVPVTPGTKIPPGTTSAVFVISTDAVQFTAGNSTIIDGGTQTVAAFQPFKPMPPTITKAFGASTIPLNGSTSLTFTFANPNAGASLTSVTFTDTLPAGLAVSTPNGLTAVTCTGAATPGSVTATAGSSTVSLAASVIAAGVSCSFSVNVTGITAGVQNNSVTITDGIAGANPTAATATITVVAPPILAKAFALPSIPVNETTLLSFSLTNPKTTVALSGVGFTDTLPAGLVIATPNGFTSSCTGTITATAGSNTISLVGATLAAGASCSIGVNVTGITVGLQNNTTSTVSSIEGGTGAAASARITVTAPSDAFLVRYAANLSVGDSYVDITNTGRSGGNLCANVYTFDPAEELISCCTCSVTPNGLQSLSVRNSLISNPLTPAIPSSVAIKILASTGACNAATVTTATLAAGLRAWGTTLHALPTTPLTYGTTETPFTNSSLSASELSHITSFCGFIQSDGSGFGICKGCSAGGLGAIPAQ